MKIFQSPLVYSMIARDVMVVLPPKLLRVVHTDLWPKNPKDRAKLGMPAHQRASKPINEQLNPLIESTIIHGVEKDQSLANHSYILETNEGNLPDRLVEAMHACKEHLGKFMRGEGGLEPAMRTMGGVALYTIDMWNPFNLIDGDDNLDLVKHRFMADLETHVEEMPFFWSLVGKDETHIYENNPSMDKMSVVVSAQRRVPEILPKIANCYLYGNGYPAANTYIKTWYDMTANALGRAWLFCTR